MLYFEFPGLLRETPRAEVAELADALASGASGRKPMKVRVLSSAPAFAGFASFGWASQRRLSGRSAEREGGPQIPTSRLQKMKHSACGNVEIIAAAPVGYLDKGLLTGSMEWTASRIHHRPCTPRHPCMCFRARSIRAGTMWVLPRMSVADWPFTTLASHRTRESIARGVSWCRSSSVTQTEPQRSRLT
jgi:hypothetical protein